MDNKTDVPGYGHKLINNLSYGTKRELIQIDPAKCVLSANSFTLGLKLSAKDFVSLDEAELLRPRQPDGSLPAINFMQPAAGSAMIDSGVQNGVPEQGTARVIGALAPGS